MRDIIKVHVYLLFISALMFLLRHLFAASLCEAMKKRRETPIVQEIGDVVLARVSLIYPF